MRKFTLFLGGCLLAASTMTASGLDGLRGQSMKKDISRMAVEKVERPAGARDFKFHKESVDASTGRLRKAAPQADSEHPVITEVPEGVTKVYSKACAGVMVYIWWMIEYEEAGLAAEVVYCDNGDVYFKDILSMAAANSYVKGHLDGSTITVELPQYIADYPSQGYAFKLMALEEQVDEDGYVDFIPDEEKTSVTYTVDDDGSLTMEEGVTIGIVYDDVDPTYNNVFVGYCDYTQSYTPFEGTPVAKPEAVVSEKWAMTTADGAGYFVDVAVDGSDLYIGGLSESMPDAWFKGTIDGDKVSFDAGQYMGIGNGYFQYLMVATVELLPDEEGNPVETLVLSDKPAVFSYDAEARKLTAEVENIALLVNASVDEVYYLDCVIAPTIVYQEIAPAVPVNPEITAFMAYSAEDGYGGFAFDLPVFDVNGKLLDTNFYKYIIYVDGEPFTLYADEYPCVADFGVEELTEIPYDYNDVYDGNIASDGVAHEFYFMIDGFDSIGVQGIYTVDGVVNKTDIIVYNVTGNALENLGGTTGLVVPETGKTISSEKYYDLAGREVTRPAGGLYIVRTAYTDGTVKSVKRFVK